MEAVNTYPKTYFVGIPIIGIIFIAMSFGQIDPFILLMYELLLLFAYVAAVWDAKLRIIPNSLILCMLAAWVLVMVPKLFIDTGAAVRLLRDSLGGFLIGGGLFFFVYLVSRKGLGGGDVKFMAASGLYLGFGGVLSAMLLGTMLAAFVGLILIAAKKIGRKDAIPLAPFLYVGILMTVFIAWK